MKKSDLITLLKSNTEFTVEQTTDLEKLLEEFPFFNTAKIMLSVAYHQQENLKFEKQLRKAAAYAHDRKKLHELHFADNEGSPIDEETQSQAENQNDKIVETREETAAIDSNEHNTISEKATDKPNEGAQQKKQAEAEEFLEEQLITAAINSSILLEVDEESKKLEQSEEKLKQELDIEQEELEEEKNFAESESHSFTDWLSHYSDEPKEKPIWERASPEAQKGLRAFDQTSERAKQEFYSPAKMARLSVQEDDDLVTETLANIYAQQGNYEKAILAFQKLELKYPEKKIYFAGQIQRLKDELNS